MKKSLIVIITCICLILSLAACGSGSGETSQNQDNANVDNEEAEDTEPYVSDTDWEEVTYVSTDSNGYKVETTYKFSPWMLLSSNEDKIDSAWKEVGKGNEIPKTQEDWGLKLEGNSYWKQVACGNDTQLPFIHDCSDMYYCIGTVTFTNVTDGFDFSEDNPYNMYPAIHWMHEDDLESESEHSSVDSIIRYYFSSGVKETAGGYHGNLGSYAVMKSNSWGPLPFVLMTSENVSPNYPEGQNIDVLLNSYIDMGGADDTYATVGVYGQDGEFYESTYTDTED